MALWSSRAIKHNEKPLPMNSYDLHPLARETLEVFASQSYFRSLRMANALAERNATQCVRWAVNLVEPSIDVSTSGEVVTRTLAAVREAIASTSAVQLVQLDKLSEKSWCRGAFDNDSPFAQRAVARLGWASMLLVSSTTGAELECSMPGIAKSANANGIIREMANQCGMAIDMIHAQTHDGRMLIAASFSREMAAA